MNELKHNSYCSSVFKGGENQTTSEAVTSAWIALINRLEQSKGTIPRAG